MTVAVIRQHEVKALQHACSILEITNLKPGNLSLLCGGIIYERYQLEFGTSEKVSI